MVKKETLKEEKSKKKPVKNETKKVTKKNEKVKDVTPKGLKALKLEIEKVRWPNKKEMVKYSIATICFVVFFAVFFGLIELLMAFLKGLV